MKNIIGKVRNRIMSGRRKKLLCIEKMYEVSFLGNEYGGFNVCTDLLSLDSSKNIIVYSFGIGEDLSFSEALLNSFNVEIWAYDPTPKSLKYISNHKLSKCEKFHFKNVGLSDECKTEVFYLPKNEDYVSGSVICHNEVKKEGICVNMCSLEQLCEENNHDHIDILKMDIEGSEFSVFEKFPKNIRVNQICIEIHDRYFNNQIQILKKFLENMKDLKYHLVSVDESYTNLTFILE